MIKEHYALVVFLSPSSVCGATQDIMHCIGTSRVGFATPPPPAAQCFRNAAPDH
jgi:hypothetical protein